MARNVFVRYLIVFIAISVVVVAVIVEPPCPTLDDFLNRSPYLSEFNAQVYEGIWYELAFHDYTQFPNLCGCTQLHWRLSSENSSRYMDDFITSCPYDLIPIRKSYTIHMNGTVGDKHYPFFIPETGFDLIFNNTVVYFRRATNDSDTYDRAIQYQCKADGSGRRIFTGINFLSRTYFKSDTERKQAISEMIDAALQAGVEEIYLKELNTVQWETC